MGIAVKVDDDELVCEVDRLVYLTLWRAKVTSKKWGRFSGGDKWRVLT